MTVVRRFRLRLAVACCILGSAIGLGSLLVVGRLQQSRAETSTLQSYETKGAFVFKGQTGPHWLYYLGARAEYVYGISFDQSHKLADEDLCEIGVLRELQLVSLRNTRITDDSLKYLVHCPKLESICLSRTQVTDEGIAKLSKIRNLSKLGLDDTQITDKGLQSLTQLSQLETLSLRSTDIGDEGLKHLRGLRNLKRLDLAGTRITGTGLQYLIHCKELEYLSVCDTTVGDDAIPYLSKLPSLRDLLLLQTKISKNGKETLQSSLNSQVIHLPDFQYCEIVWSNNSAIDSHATLESK